MLSDWGKMLRRATKESGKAFGISRKRRRKITGLTKAEVRLIQTERHRARRLRKKEATAAEKLRRFQLRHFQRRKKGIY